VKAQKDLILRLVLVVGGAFVVLALGFFVLAFGRSPVMQLLGTLAGLTMSMSALLTCLLIPALRPVEE